MREPTSDASAMPGPDLTGLLQAWSQSDREALAELALLAQQELRHIARRIPADGRRDRRWQPTEPVQESYLRLLDWRAVRWHSRVRCQARIVEGQFPASSTRAGVSRTSGR